jgi:methanogenic corrinoid protein MtbC1
MAGDKGFGAVVDAGAFARAKGVFGLQGQRLPTEAVQALAGEVIARLSHRHVVSRPALSEMPEFALDTEMQARIRRLGEALLAVEDDAATAIVSEAHAAGESQEAIYLGLLSEAARLLGRWWEDDRVSALEVVLAAGRIYALMRSLRRLFGPPPVRGGQFRALFATTPGETHSIGVTMAADVLARHGWEIDLRAGLTHEELVAEVHPHSHDIIGLSASAPRMLFPLARLIVSLRLAHPGAWIIVSGRIAEYEPDVANLVDADAAAADLTRAEALMEAHAAAIGARAQA